MREIDAVDQDASAFRHIEPLHQLGERAFARTRGADNADHLPGGQCEVDVVQNLRPVNAVAKGDVLESNVTADRRQRRAARIVGRLGRRIEDVAEPGDGNPRLMKVLPHLGEPQHRRADTAGEDVEGDQLADREIAGDHQLGAEVKHRRGDHLADELHALARPIAELDDAKTGGDIAGKLLFPAPLHLRLDRHRFQRLDAGHAFDEKGLVFGAAREFFVQPPAEQRRRPRRDADVERKRAEHDKGQERRIDEHHRQEDEA